MSNTQIISASLLIFFFGTLLSLQADTPSLFSSRHPRVVPSYYNGIAINDVADQKEKKTPLMIAVESGDSEMMIYLFERGADLLLKNAHGETALDIAKRIHATEMEQLLLREIALHPSASEYYNKKAPKITVVSAQSQVGGANVIFRTPLSVSVTDTNGTPLPNAPVRFEVKEGDGSLVTSFLSPPSHSLVLRTDQKGICSVYFKPSNKPNNLSKITASADKASSVDFLAHTDNGISEHSSPFDITDMLANLNVDGSIDCTWQNRSNEADYCNASINLRYRDINGAWITAATVPFGTTSYHIPPQ